MKSQRHTKQEKLQKYSIKERKNYEDINGSNKGLREKTGISIMQCRKALEDAKGDMDKAIVLLQKKGAEAAGKKAERVLKSGRIVSYIHGGGSVGVLRRAVERIGFRANDDFGKLGHDIAMQIAAANPMYLKRRRARR